MTRVIVESDPRFLSCEDIETGENRVGPEGTRMRQLVPDVQRAASAVLPPARMRVDCFISPILSPVRDTEIDPVVAQFVIKAELAIEMIWRPFIVMARVKVPKRDPGSPTEATRRHAITVPAGTLHVAVVSVPHKVAMAAVAWTRTRTLGLTGAMPEPCKVRLSAPVAGTFVPITEDTVD